MSDRPGRRLGRRTLLGAGALAAGASLLPAACAHARPRLPVRQPGERPTPVLNLRAFGAKGDGRTNDTDAFARAAAAINAAGRGTLLIPPGTYAILARFARRFVDQEWPGARRPELYYDPRSLRPASAERSSLHAKCVAIDGRVGLI